MAEKQTLEYWPIERLIEYARNPRVNNHAVDRVASAIHTFGFRVPIIAKSDGTVVDGHLRLKAAKKLGLDTVPVMLADDMSDIEIRAFRLSVNRMAELADWDNDLLAIELEELKLEEFDLELLGFDEDYLKDLGLNIDEIEMPTLKDGDKEPFQQKTFTLHDEQALIVDDAVTLARTNPLSDTGLNENTNGNALALICKEWLAHGNR